MLRGVGKDPVSLLRGQIMCLGSEEQRARGAEAGSSGEEFRYYSEGSGGYREVLKGKGGAWSDSEAPRPAGKPDM